MFCIGNLWHLLQMYSFLVGLYDFCFCSGLLNVSNLDSRAHCLKRLNEEPSHFGLLKICLEGFIKMFFCLQGWHKEYTSGHFLYIVYVSMPFLLWLLSAWRMMVCEICLYGGLNNISGTRYVKYNGGSMLWLLVSQRWSHWQPAKLLAGFLTFTF